MVTTRSVLEFIRIFDFNLLDRTIEKDDIIVDENCNFLMQESWKFRLNFLFFVLFNQESITRGTRYLRKQQRRNIESLGPPIEHCYEELFWVQCSQFYNISDSIYRILCWKDIKLQFHLYYYILLARECSRSKHTYSTTLCVHYFPRISDEAGQAGDILFKRVQDGCNDATPQQDNSESSDANRESGTVI